MNNIIVKQLTQFLEDEARSCSMDPGLITPLYVYRMWGGRVSLVDISAALEEMKGVRNINETTCINNNAQL